MRLPKPPPTSDALSLLERLAVLAAHLAEVNVKSGTYLPFDELRHRTRPDSVSENAWWFAHKAARSIAATTIPLPIPGANPTLVRTDTLLESITYIERTCAGQLGTPEHALGATDPQRFVISALREEAIQSSLLEGAATTRREAQEMLRTQRAPRTHGERMVANNYAGIRWIREHQTAAVTPDAIRTLHSVLTEGTLDDADVGRVQTPDETRVSVRSWLDDTVLHHPPPAERIPEQLSQLCAFAMEEQPGPWLHPVERAILVHFWFAWLHPFVDGNGRTARALFYWVMLKKGFWFTEYVTLSRRLRKAPAQYARAFLHTEMDEYDLTYFVLHQLKAFRAAVDDAREYVQRKATTLRQAESRLRLAGVLNGRQMALIQHARTHTTPEYTIASHQHSHGVSYPTARSDLYDLRDKALLRSFKRSRKLVFVPVDALDDAIAAAVAVAQR